MLQLIILLFTGVISQLPLEAIMKLGFALFTFCLILKLTNCYQKNLTAIELLPCSSSERGVRLWSASEKIVLDLSFCIRFKIKSWNYNSFLVKSDNFFLVLTPFDPEYFGIFQYYNETYNGYYALGPNKVISFSTSTWNSICLSYNALTKSLKIFVNGIAVEKNILYGSGMIGNFSLSQMEIGSFINMSAYFTDFNAWSRALSAEEALHFSAGTDSYASVKFIPDLFDWKNINGVRLNNKCAEWRSLDAERVSMNNGKFKNAEIIFMKNQSFDEALRACQSLNGALFDPKSNSYFDRTENITNMLKMCGNQIWVPYQKVSPEGLLTKTNFETEEVIYQRKNCTYFGYLEKKYDFTYCESTEPCTLCEIDQSRLGFQLRFDFQNALNIANSPFAIQQQDRGEVMFTGIVYAEKFSLAIIERMESKWTFGVLFKNGTRIVAESMTENIFGLSLWTSDYGGKNFTSRVKITNVSFLFIINRYLLACDLNA